MKNFGGDFLEFFVENIGGKYLMERFWWKMFGIKFSGKFSTKCWCTFSGGNFWWRICGGKFGKKMPYLVSLNPMR